MKNTSFLIKTTLFLSYILFMNSGSLLAFLLSNEEIDRRNYTAVRIWHSKKIEGVENFGHAALQVFKNDSLLFNASLYPGDTGIGLHNLTQEVPAYWMTPEEEDARGAPNEVVKLYSLNLERMKTEFDNLKTSKRYPMITVGGSDRTVFQRDCEFFSRNCVSLVRDVLNAGSLKDLFEKPLDQSAVRVAGSVIRHGVPGAAKTAVEVLAGVGGGSTWDS